MGTRKFSHEGILLNDNTEINTEIRLEFIYTDKMEFHVIELPKLPRELSDGCSRLELRAKSFFF